MKCPTIHIASTICFAMLSSLAAPAADPAPKPSWTVDDALSWEWATDFNISPDCRWAAWVKSVPDKEKNEWVGNVFLSSLTETNEIQLTRSLESCASPKWSPDGRRIAFLSSRPAPRPKPDTNNKNQLWLINPFGGEPWPLTQSERAISGFDWAGTNKLIYSAQEEPSFYEQSNKDKKETSQVVEDEAHEPPVRLFETDLEGKTIRRLTRNADRIGAFWVSPDAAWAVAVHQRSLRNAYDQSLMPVVFLWNLKTREGRQLFADPELRVWGLRWQQDSKAFYAMVPHSASPRYASPATVEVYRYSVENEQTRKVNLDWDNGLAGTDLEVTEDGFVTLLADGVRSRAARYSREGERWRREWLSGLHATNLSGFAAGKDGRTLLYEYSTQHPGQWYRARLNGARLESPVRLTSLNTSLEKKTFAKCEVVHWKGARGETVEGLLHFPHDYQEGKKYPLVVDIHGGPAAAVMDNWRFNNDLLNARGAFVFQPNYHGSSNYGLKWMESDLGRLNEFEVQDIESGVDYLLGRGFIAPDRLAVMGWSQGGVLTAALTVRTNRYRAAIAGDGVVDWIDYWGKSDIGGWFCGNYLKTTPLENPGVFLRTSSFYQMGKVTTPTLIMFGSEDKRVPTEQGWMHYRALQQSGKTDVRFILFPGDGHGPSKLVHIRRAIEEYLAWFDKYLFQNAKEDSGELKPDAPLSVALKLKGARADGHRYGLMQNGKLIPETVQHDALEVGRFEVTCAQFAEFDPSHAVEQGQENFPVGGVSFEQAKAYCAWLSKVTAAHYRLPTSSEGDSLYKSSGAENTLDYWAGRPVNPDDAASLLAKIKELGAHASLLKEVGSFKPSSADEPLFDLGGNVAEWTVAPDGTGKVMGPSADSPADEKLLSRHPAPEYIGLRVIKGRAPQ